MIERFERFVNAISSIDKNIRKIKSMEMREFGLKGPHVMSLFYLARHPEGLTAAQLCQLISVDKAAMSRVLAELRTGEFVCYPEQESGRKYRAVIVLTERGKTVSQELDRIICAVVDQIGTGLTPQEREIFYRSLDLIDHNLECLLAADGALKAKDVSEQNKGEPS